LPGASCIVPHWRGRGWNCFIKKIFDGVECHVYADFNTRVPVQVFLTQYKYGRSCTCTHTHFYERWTSLGPNFRIRVLAIDEHTSVCDQGACLTLWPHGVLAVLVCSYWCRVRCETHQSKVEMGYSLIETWVLVTQEYWVLVTLQCSNVD
jgi:hypothetical protein